MHECPLVKDNWKRNIAKIKMSHIIEDVSSRWENLISLEDRAN